jgi:hypothetical protein
VQDGGPMSGEEIMDTLMATRKWRQFVEDVRLRWPLLNSEDNSMNTTDEIADRLSENAGMSRSRSQREVKEMIELFAEKIRRAA